MVPDTRRILKRYERLRLADANEAETRLKLINEVLGLLNWTPDDFTVEEHIIEDGITSYADYIIRTANTGLVIEAKRIGSALLEVPNSRRVQLVGKIMTGETGEAIKQARDYARKKSVPFAVVTNGDRWIVMPGARSDMIPFSQSSAVVFPSLHAILTDNFDEFYALLSRDSVISASLENELLGRRDDQIQGRRLNQIFSKPFHTSAETAFTHSSRRRLSRPLPIKSSKKTMISSRNHT